MPTTVYKWRIWCNTESEYKYSWAESEPTVCPSNEGHSIDSTKTTIVESLGEQAPTKVKSSFSVSYSVWKQVTQSTCSPVYHFVEDTNDVSVWTGNYERGLIYRSRAIGDDYTDWDTNFSSESTEVTLEDDAEALILGISKCEIPREHDGKPVMVVSPSTEGLYTWISSQGDDLSPSSGSGRGEGQQLLINFSSPDSDSVELDLCEPWELNRGFTWWKNGTGTWDFDDKWSFGIRIPASTVTVNGSNTGNCNLVDVPGTGGTLHIIVPADDDGTHDIDLVNDAVPVPAGKTEDSYWDCDRDTEVITALPKVKLKKWNLYDFEIKMYFCKNISCGNPSGNWTFRGDKAEWLSSKWKVIFECTKSSSGSGQIGGYLVVFRPGAT